MLGQAGVPLTSGFLGKWVVIQAVLGQGQYELGLIGMVAAAVAAFFYLRVALIMFLSTEGAGAATAPAGATLAVQNAGGPPTGSAPAPAVAGEFVGAASGYAGSDLQAIATAGLSGRDKALALRPPPGARPRVSTATAAVIAICVAFTVFAGVSTPVLSFAHSISLPWSA
jgi:NADH:ubiquinone oxidoreductase subunit 5 (subunit L)/multisubunit Na+/H+ antiporter MnhA subunit